MNDFIYQYRMDDGTWRDSRIMSDSGAQIPPSVFGVPVLYRGAGENMYYRRVPKDPLLRAMVLAELEEK